MHELAVGAGEAGLADAMVPLHVLPVDAATAVVTRVVQALVAVNAALSVRGHALTARTALQRLINWLVKKFVRLKVWKS